MCDEIALARELLARAPRILVLTGAGLGEEAGIPACYSAGASCEQEGGDELATPEAFARDPRRVWEWYAAWRTAASDCVPGAAHLSLARFARRHPNTLLATQGVDGLHALAATACGATTADDPAQPVELLGNLFRLRCTDCGATWDDRAPIDAGAIEDLPRCRTCGALARPDVVWFGEALDRPALSRVLRQTELAVVCLVIGTAAAAQPAAHIAAVTAQAGGEVIEISAVETELTALCSVTLREPATRAVPGLFDDTDGSHGACA